MRIAVIYDNLATCEYFSRHKQAFRKALAKMKQGPCSHTSLCHQPQAQALRAMVTQGGGSLSVLCLLPLTRSHSGILTFDFSTIHQPASPFQARLLSLPPP